MLLLLLHPSLSLPRLLLLLLLLLLSLCFCSCSCFCSHSCSCFCSCSCSRSSHALEFLPNPQRGAFHGALVTLVLNIKPEVPNPKHQTISHKPQALKRGTVRRISLAFRVFSNTSDPATPNSKKSQLYRRPYSFPGCCWLWPLRRSWRIALAWFLPSFPS